MKKKRYNYTKTPLSYQITEYDCASATLLNAVRYLFNREEISPQILKCVMQYTLDNISKKGEIGKGGTSTYALELLSNWLNEPAQKENMKITSKIVRKEISIYNKELVKWVKEGGVAILRVWQECEHYVLCTKITKDYVYVFDPYYLDITYYDKDDKCEIIKNRAFEFNRKIKKERLEEENREDYSLVKGKHSQILLMKRA